MEEQSSDWEEDTEYMHWEALIESYLEENSPLSAEEVAQKGNELSEQSMEYGYPCGVIDNFWGAIYERGVITPYDDPAQKRLSELAIALVALPPKYDGRNEAINIWKYGSGIEAHRIWSIEGIDKSDITEEQPDEIVSRYENLCAIFARMMTPGSTLEMSCFGDTIHVFEEPSPMISAVRGAALWIKIAGQELYARLSIKDYLSEDRLFMLLSNWSEYKGKNGWCRERWDFWKMKFQSIVGNYDGETRQLVIEAIQRMEELEKGG